MTVCVVRIIESAAIGDLIVQKLEISAVHTVDPAGEIVRTGADAVAPLAAGVDGHPLHAGQLLHLRPGRFRNRLHTSGRGIIGKVIGIVVLIELHRYHIAAGADQVLLDLFIGALDGGHNGDDGGDADDDTQHGQEGAHFMAPDSLKRQSDIFHTPHLLNNSRTGCRACPPGSGRPL